MFYNKDTTSYIRIVVMSLRCEHLIYIDVGLFQIMHTT